MILGDVCHAALIGRELGSNLLPVLLQPKPEQTNGESKAPQTLRESLQKWNRVFVYVLKNCIEVIGLCLLVTLQTPVPTLKPRGSREKA